MATAQATTALSLRPSPPTEFLLNFCLSRNQPEINPAMAVNENDLCCVACASSDKCELRIYGKCLHVVCQTCSSGTAQCPIAECQGSSPLSLDALAAPWKHLVAPPRELVTHTMREVHVLNNRLLQNAQVWRPTPPLPPHPAAVPSRACH